MSNIIIGKHTLESLTTGMYADPYVVFREYIQNAADAIDNAVRQSLLTSDSAKIVIHLSPAEKSIIISDFLTENDYLSAIDYLRDKHRDVLCIQLLAPEEINPSSRGKNIFYDAEDTNKFFKGNVTRDVLNAYHKALDFVQDRLTNYCASREADFTFYDTSISLRELFMDRLFNKGVIR